MGSSAPDNVRRLVDHFDRDRAAREIAGRINALVYGLYGLAEGEIRTVECGADGE